MLRFVIAAFLIYAIGSAALAQPAPQSPPASTEARVLYSRLAQEIDGSLKCTVALVDANAMIAKLQAELAELKKPADKPAAPAK